MESLDRDVTFDELVQHGINQGVPVYNGMPWSFDFFGHRITHENDNCYLVPVPSSKGFAKFMRGQVLVLEDGLISHIK